MSQVASPTSWGQKLQNIPREWLFLILIVCATIPLFFKVSLPNTPSDASIDFFANTMNLKEGDKVLIGSDWTLSTRAESGSGCEALLRILIRKGVKIAAYSSGDAQAPQVFRDTLGRIAEEEHAAGGPLYQRFTDYVNAGYFPNAEGTALGINNNIRATFAGKKDSPVGGIPTDIMTSPVFEGINSVSDFKYLILISPSNTDAITIQRVNKVPMMFMVTGVMTPQDQNYFASGQLKGLIGGIKGVFDLELLMEKGLNVPGGYAASRLGVIEPLKGIDEGRGTSYYFALHICLALLIGAVFLGNLGVWISRRNGSQA